MPLQTSGAISLNDIHIEAGGSSGTTCAINNADIRALIGKSSGAQMSFSEWYGASSAWTSTMGVGSWTFVKTQYYGYVRSFATSGTLTDNTIDTFGNRTIVDFYWNASNTVQLNIANGPNSGWSSISVGGMTFSRSAASYGNNLWSWASITNNPFGTSGNKTIQFNI